MAEFICRLGTPAGEVVTRTVEATGIHEARARLEREGFRVFNVSPPRTSGVSALTRLGGRGAHPKVKANDFLLFNQQLAALSRAGMPGSLLEARWLVPVDRLRDSHLGVRSRGGHRNSDRTEPAVWFAVGVGCLSNCAGRAGRSLSAAEGISLHRSFCYRAHWHHRHVLCDRDCSLPAQSVRHPGRICPAD